MKREHVSLVDGRYWAAILLASVFGTNLGDLYAHDSGLDLGLGLLVLAGIAGAAFAAERFDERSHVGWYWLLIIVIRTGATNIADWLAFRIRVPQPPLIAALSASIACFASLSAARAGGRGDDLPATEAAYWAAMLSAGVFGTVIGDVCSHAAGEFGASIALLALFAAALILRRGRILPSVLTYWLTISTAQSAGTSMGDWIAENHLINLGLPLATVLTGAAFLVVVTLTMNSGRSRGIAA